MLSNSITEPIKSEWSSPCLLVAKCDGSYKFYTDFCKAKLVAKADSYPIPHVKDCTDKVRSAWYASVVSLTCLKDIGRYP